MLEDFAELVYGCYKRNKKINMLLSLDSQNLGRALAIISFSLAFGFSRFLINNNFLIIKTLYEKHSYKNGLKIHLQAKKTQLPNNWRYVK